MDTVQLSLINFHPLTITHVYENDGERDREEWSTPTLLRRPEPWQNLQCPLLGLRCSWMLVLQCMQGDLWTCWGCCWTPSWFIFFSFSWSRLWTCLPLWIEWQILSRNRKSGSMLIHVGLAVVTARVTHGKGPRETPVNTGDAHGKRHTKKLLTNILSIYNALIIELLYHWTSPIKKWYRTNCKKNILISTRSCCVEHFCT